jgi:hypothetical protein
VLDWPAAAGLKRPDGIGCWHGGPSAGIEVTSPCVGRHIRLPMPGRQGIERSDRAAQQKADTSQTYL